MSEIISRRPVDRVMPLKAEDMLCLESKLQIASFTRVHFVRTNNMLMSRQWQSVVQI